MGQLLLGLAPTAPLFLAGIPVWSLFGLATPSLQAIASRSVEPTEQGQLQGALASLRSVATLITPILYTQTFAAAIGPLASLGLPGASFLLSACLLFISAVIVLRAMPAHATQAAGQRTI